MALDIYCRWHEKAEGGEGILGTAGACGLLSASRPGLQGEHSPARPRCSSPQLRKLQNAIPKPGPSLLPPSGLELGKGFWSPTGSEANPTSAQSPRCVYLYTLPGPRLDLRPCFHGKPTSPFAGSPGTGFSLHSQPCDKKCSPLIKIM